jgi:hypothetical protein
MGLGEGCFSHKKFESFVICLFGFKTTWKENIILIEFGIRILEHQTNLAELTSNETRK